jgi:hypothetical protein
MLKLAKVLLRIATKPARHFASRKLHQLANRLETSCRHASQDLSHLADDIDAFIVWRRQFGDRRDESPN